MPTLDEFLEAQGTGLKTMRALPLVNEVVVPFVALYERGVELIPGATGEFHAHLYLMCFRSYLSAVSQILRLMPDDSAPVTRRAVEMARVALAVKYKPANYVACLDYARRLARWDARGRQETSGAVSPKYDLPKGHQVLDRLSQALGTLSDSATHFTPEFLGQLRPTIVAETEVTITRSLSFFVTDPGRLHHSICYLVTVHGLITEAFDECFDRGLRRDQAWAQEFERLRTVLEGWGPKVAAMMRADFTGRKREDPDASPR